MKYLKNIFQNHDWIISIIMIVLTIIGLMTVYSNTYQANTLISGKGAFEKQLIFCVLGVILYFILSNFDYGWLKHKEVWIPIYIVVLLLLIFVLIWGTRIANVQRWINIGIFQIQPSELAKLVVLIYTASIVTKFYEKIKNKSKTLLILLLLFLTGIYFILIYLQPSAGNALILLIFFFTTLVISLPSQKKILASAFILFLLLNLSFKFINFNFIYNLLNFNPIIILNVDILLLIASVGVIAFLFISKTISLKLGTILIAIGLIIFPLLSISWESNILKPYQKARIIAFVNPEIAIEQNKDSLYQLNLAKDAIGSGRLLGLGYLNGTQKVPFEYTDFAFTGFAEEFGFAGSVILILIFGVLIIRIFLISSRATNVFSGLLCIGIAIYLLIHIFFSIGTNLGLVVNTGIPLPFLSYGGTSTIVAYLLLGIAQSCSRKALKFDLESKVMLTSKSPWRV